MPAPLTPQTKIARAHSFLDKHRAKALGVLATVAILALIVQEIWSPFEEYLSNSGVVSLLTLLVVIDIATTTASSHSTRSHSIAPNQDQSLPVLTAGISSCKKHGCDLIEYAGATTLPLIREMERQNVPVRILVKHPETVTGLQRDRMITTLDTLVTSIFEDAKSSYEIRCYRLPYTLRGRKLGGRMLELGWLTPDPTRETAFGHANPSLVVDLTSGDHDHLVEFFDRTFDTLWDHAETEEATTVLASLNGTGATATP